MFGLPGEFTTMAGRRLKSEIQLFAKSRSHEFSSILCGLSNIYTSYVTTPEEYEIQRYEGASTIFGPHTLTIYTNKFVKLLDAILRGSSVDPGPMPIDQDTKQISLMTRVFYDGHPIGSGFGYVIQQPRKVYKCGEIVFTSFIAGNPRNNFMTDSSFFFVERLISRNDSEGSDEWKVVATDANWETKFKWIRVSMIFGRSDIEFFWEIPRDTKPGEYRVKHEGFYRYILGGVYPYQGSTESFQIVKN